MGASGPVSERARRVTAIALLTVALAIGLVPQVALAEDPTTGAVPPATARNAGSAVAVEEETPAAPMTKASGPKGESLAEASCLEGLSAAVGFGSSANVLSELESRSASEGRAESGNTPEFGNLPESSAPISDDELLSVSYGGRTFEVNGGSIVDTVHFGMAEPLVFELSPEAKGSLRFAQWPTIVASSGNAEDYLSASFDMANQRFEVSVERASAASDDPSRPYNVSFYLEFALQDAGDPTAALRTVTYRIPVIEPLELTLRDGAGFFDVPYGREPHAFANDNADMCFGLTYVERGGFAPGRIEEVLVEDLSLGSVNDLFEDGFAVAWSGTMPDDYPRRTDGEFASSLLRWGALKPAYRGNVAAEDETLHRARWVVTENTTSDTLEYVAALPDGSSVRGAQDPSDPGVIWVRSTSVAVSRARCLVGLDPCELLALDSQSEPEELLLQLAPDVPRELEFHYRFRPGGNEGIDEDLIYTERKTLQVDTEAPVIADARVERYESSTEFADEENDAEDRWAVHRTEDDVVAVVTLYVADLATPGLSDAASGLDSAYGHGGIAVEGVEEQGASWNYDATTGRLTVCLDAANARMDLSQVFLSAKDVAGNETPVYSLTELLGEDEKVRFVATDDAAPTVTVAWDNVDVRNGRYYNAQRTATVGIAEANFDLLLAAASRTEVVRVVSDDSRRSYTASDFEQAENGLWYLILPFEYDGDFVLDTLGFLDSSGRAANARSEDFTVDTVAPLLAVSWDNNEAGAESFYKDPRTATIDVVERNFSSDLVSAIVAVEGGAAPGVEDWLSRDDRHMASVRFGEEGTCRLVVEAQDLAGNRAEGYDSEGFSIDLTPPEVVISQVEDFHAYAGDVAPRVSASDAHLQEFVTVELTDANTGDPLYRAYEREAAETSFEQRYASFGRTLENDGVCRLRAVARDKAGNETERAVVFSVNRFGSTYFFDAGTGEALGRYLDYAPEVTVTEVNPSGLLDGSLSVRLTHDDRSRVLDRGTEYVVGHASGQKWPSSTYVIPSESFAEDGYYRIAVSSRDAAGNPNANDMATRGYDHQKAAEISFAVDTEPPNAQFAGLRSLEMVYAPQHEMRAFLRDNLELESTEIEVNGVKAASWHRVDGGAGQTLDFKVPASDGPQTIVANVVDRSGNTSRVVLENVRVTDDFFLFWLSTPSLFYGSIAAALCAAALLSAAVSLGVRTHRRRRRATFG